MKNKLTDRAPKKQATDNSNSQDTSTEDEIIELDNLVEEDDLAPAKSAHIGKVFASKPGVQSFKVGKEDEVTKNAGAEEVALNRSATSDTGGVTEDADHKPVREKTAEWDIYTTLCNFFDSCDLEVSKLVGKAEKIGNEIQVHSDSDNAPLGKSSGDLNTKLALDNKDHIAEETLQAADELLEELSDAFEMKLDEVFDVLEMKREAIGEDYTQEEDMSEARNDSPEDLFNDPMTETSSGIENSAVEKKVNLDNGLVEDLFVYLEPNGKASAPELSELEVVQPQLDSTPKSHRKDWLGTDQYSLKIRTVEQKIAEHQRKIEQLMVKKEKMKKQYEHLNDILYKKGEELKKAVSVVLKEYWSLKIGYMNKEKRASFDENIIIQLEGKNILAKIKTTDKRKLPNTFIAQIWQDLYFSNLGASAEGALIVNHDIRRYEKDNVPEYIAIDKELLEDIIFIDTRELYNLTIAILSNNLSIHEAKRILFNKG